MKPIPTPWPAAFYRSLFQNWRVRGHMRLGSWMSRLFPSMQNVAVPHHAGELHLDLRDLDQQRIFLDGGVKAEPDEVALVQTLVKPGNIVMDVGAHLGVYSTMLAELVGPSGLVLAYEPHPTMIYLNAIPYQQLIVRPFAVSEQEGAIGFETDRSSALSHVSTTATSTSNLKSVTLDQEVARLKLPKVDFLKIDVEGHEEFALRGASRLLTNDSPPILLFEFVPFFRPRWKQGAIQTLKNMLKPGWSGLALGFDGTKKEWNDWSEAAANTNYLLIPPHRSELFRELR